MPSSPCSAKNQEHLHYIFRAIWILRESHNTLRRFCHDFMNLPFWWPAHSSNSHRVFIILCQNRRQNSWVYFRRSPQWDVRSYGEHLEESLWQWFFYSKKFLCILIFTVSVDHILYLQKAGDCWMKRVNIHKEKLTNCRRKIKILPEELHKVTCTLGGSGTWRLDSPWGDFSLIQSVQTKGSNSLWKLCGLCITN